MSTPVPNIAAYDWVLDCTSVCKTDDCDCDGGVLHAAPSDVLPQFDDWDGDPVDSPAACGVGSRLTIPGVGSRMCLPRCVECCALTGLPTGVGSPKNDAACRVILGMEESGPRPFDPAEAVSDDH